jgi:hypothetical protein
MPMFAQSDPFSQGGGSGMGQMMDMLQLVNQIQGMRRQQKADEEVSQKKGAMEKALGMTYPEIEAQMTVMQFKNMQDGMAADEAKAQSENQLRAALAAFGLTPEQVKAKDMYSQMQTGAANAQQATAHAGAMPAEQEAARARVSGLHTTAQALLDQIGGGSDLMNLAGGNTALGSLITSSFGMSPSARVLHEAINQTPDLTGLPIEALNQHEARLSDALRSALAFQGESRSEKAAAREGSQKGADIMGPYRTALVATKDALDFAQQRLVAMEGNQLGRDESEYQAVKGQVANLTQQYAQLQQYVGQGEANLALGVQPPVSVQQIPQPGALGEQASPQQPAILPGGGLPNPADESPLDINRWLSAEKQARKKLGRRADQKAVDDLAADFYMGRQ